LLRFLIAAALAASLAASLAAPAARAQSADDAAAGRSNVLRVTVAGVSSSRGHVRVDVCSRTEFLGECRYSGSAPAQPGATIVEVRDLPPGVYAVQAYDDRNDNQKVDRNLIGLPTEGVGFSNNAPVPFSGPSFKAAAFAYRGGEQSISLRLRRFIP
jgi:uncharacterized protein (DUF2141 family)